MLEVLATTMKQDGIKGIQIGKEEVKLSLFADNVILYTENPKDFIKKLLELINEFGQVAGYKINIQKLVAFLYTNNKLLERETKKKIPSKNKIKYLRIYLTKEVKDLYSKNHKILKKETEKDTNK